MCACFWLLQARMSCMSRRVPSSPATFAGAIFMLSRSSRILSCRSKTTISCVLVASRTYLRAAAVALAGHAQQAGADAVAVVYPYRTEVAETVLAGRAPANLAASAGPDYLFVANPPTGDVTMLDIESRRARLVAAELRRVRQRTGRE